MHLTTGTNNGGKHKKESGRLAACGISRMTSIHMAKPLCTLSSCLGLRNRFPRALGLDEDSSGPGGHCSGWIIAHGPGRISLLNGSPNMRTVRLQGWTFRK